MEKKTDESEAILVKALSRGSLLAFNTLFSEYSGKLYRFAHGYLKSEHESEELVQEVFTIIWEKRSEIKEELSFRSFLFTVSFNIIRKHFRRRKYLSKYLNSGIIEDMDLHTMHQITCDSLYGYIIDLVDRLPQRRKEIFIKSRFEGLTVKEISEELKISHKTVENQLTNALKYLRHHLHNEKHLIVFLLAALMIW